MVERSEKNIPINNNNKENSGLNIKHLGLLTVALCAVIQAILLEANPNLLASLSCSSSS
jgi:hypothetical protein